MQLQKITSCIRDNIFSIAAYTATLYYLEIINMMFSLALLFGKIPSVTAGLVCSAFLTLHIILLNLGKNRSRIAHLVIMDLHAALSFSSVASFWLLESQPNAFNIIQIVVRVIIFMIEIPLIFALTDILIIRRFKKESGLIPDSWDFISPPNPPMGGLKSSC